MKRLKKERGSRGDHTLVKRRDLKGPRGETWERLVSRTEKKKVNEETEP